MSAVNPVGGALDKSPVDRIAQTEAYRAYSDQATQEAQKAQLPVALLYNLPDGMQPVGAQLPLDLEAINEYVDKLRALAQAGEFQVFSGQGHFILVPIAFEISEAEKKVLEEMFSTDTDGDGILDFLDRTGKETLIEEMYDNAFNLKIEELKANIRALLSLFSIFNNLDLTKFASTPTEHGGDPLIVMVAAGAAQAALMHSASLQTLPPDAVGKKKDFQTLIRKYKQQSKEQKAKNLKVLEYFVASIPDDDVKNNPKIAALKVALQRALPNAMQRATGQARPEAGPPKAPA
jgi:hypothetical protein